MTKPYPPRKSPSPQTVSEVQAVYRVNARFDEDMNDKLTQLAAATGLSTSDVLREAVSRMHSTVAGARKASRSRLDGLVGRYNGDANLSAHYKSTLTESLGRKHGA